MGIRMLASARRREGVRGAIAATGGPMELFGLQEEVIGEIWRGNKGVRCPMP